MCGTLLQQSDKEFEVALYTTNNWNLNLYHKKINLVKSKITRHEKLPATYAFHIIQDSKFDQNNSETSQAHSILLNVPTVKEGNVKHSLALTIIV